KRISTDKTEQKVVRAALLEERGRFCHLAKLIKPVLDEEIAMLMDLTHLQEVFEQLELHTRVPYDLLAYNSGHWPLHHHLTSTNPLSSPSLSLGSRKSFMCSSSESCKNHPSPAWGHPHHWPRSFSQEDTIII
ncbi:GSCOCG00012073001-RA-CDS, partial [Cotesia congregata]